MSKRYIFIIAVMIFLTAACGVTHRLPSKRAADVGSSMAPAMDAARFSKIQKSLKRAYTKWKGTPYEWGGETLRGVDCSALMQVIFKAYFGVDIPRTTTRQIYAGREVDRQNLKPGDLVFFKTGRKTLHVGVILEKRKFIHASTSQGVMISSLENYYWRSRYLTAKRVLP